MPPERGAQLTYIMPWTGLIAGAAAGLAGGAMQGGFSMAATAQQQEAQERAYKHRYQWQQEDLKKAGLNPMLTMAHGVGSVGQMSKADTPDIDIAGNTQKFSAAQLQKEQVATQKNQTVLTGAEAAAASSDAELKEATNKIILDNPTLLSTHAITQSGMNPNTPIGAAAHSAHQLAPYVGKDIAAAIDTIKEAPAASKRVAGNLKTRLQHMRTARKIDDYERARSFKGPRPPLKNGYRVK